MSSHSEIVAVAEVLVAAASLAAAERVAAIEASIAALREVLTEERTEASLREEEELEALYHKRTYPAPLEEVEPEEEDEEDDAPSQWYPAYWREYYPSGN